MISIWRQKLAVGQGAIWLGRAGAVIIGVLALVVVFGDLIAPYPYSEQSRREPSVPPSTLTFVDQQGEFHLRPFIHAQRLEDPLTLRYGEDTTRAFPVEFLTTGYEFKLLGLITVDTHLFGLGREATADDVRIRILGTDALGRDRFSRLVQATRFSLIVCTIGAITACLIGIFVGAVSGYAHRTIDLILMGIADSVISLPTLIIILAARAAFPLELPPTRAATLLIGIFALTGWAEMARLTRALVHEVRNRDFILAAKASGLTEARTLVRHVIPNISRQLFAQAALILPAFLLAEVALSFLGVGLQEPEPSLGNMLTAATDISQLARSTFVLLSPAFVIFVFVLGVRLVGDALMRRGERI